MNTILDITSFSLRGQYLMYLLLILATAMGISGAINIKQPHPVWGRFTFWVFAAVNLLFLAGFIWLCWFHYQIYCKLPLELPANLVDWYNNHLGAMNSQSPYGIPLLDISRPPRYTVPIWIENEKYYFWFMCYSVMAFIAHVRIDHHRLRALLHLLLSVQALILFFFTDPFSNPLPRFFAEIQPWFENALSPMERIRLFMQLYPRMVFYYNAAYMWVHPPMLFISYACITLTFVTSIIMLMSRDPAIENAGYDFAKLGFMLLTLGMLIGYPWALKAWGENWWWDPKICTSIMMWSVFSTYLHTRLYAGRTGMWYFTAGLGILCYLAMIFTFLTSLFFPGEHTLQ
jgi:hypothetical protein